MNRINWRKTLCYERNSHIYVEPWLVATIIDHIYYHEGSNYKKDMQLVSGNLWSDLTDHLPTYVITLTQILLFPSVSVSVIPFVLHLLSFWL